MDVIANSLNKIDAVNSIKKEYKAGRIVVAIIGIGFLAFSMYAMHLTIKSNRLQIKKLKDEGYS